MYPAYNDFSTIFHEASERACRKHSGPLTAKEEAESLAWVAAMAAEQADFNELGAAEWLSGTAGFDNDIELPPLAIAVLNGLSRTAQTLIAHGANPDFAFNFEESGGIDFEINILDLAQGWSPRGYRSEDCHGLIEAAIEKREIARAVRKPKRSTNKAFSL